MKKERANEIGLSQFGVGEGSQFISKKKSASEENLGTIYTQLSGQKLSYPAIVFDRSVWLGTCLIFRFYVCLICVMYVNTG
jgi:hypothetical protein